MAKKRPLFGVSNYVKRTRKKRPGRHIKHNKALYTQNDGYSKSRELKRVASIPTIALSVWANEYNGDSNWFGLPKEVQKKILKEKLNSSEFRYFRTAEGKI